jgi:hypothetical protein
MISLVPLIAHVAKKIPFPLIKVVLCPVYHVLLVVHPNKAVQNVPIAHRANLNTMSTTKKYVPSAPLDLHKVKRIKPVALNVQRDTKQPTEAVVLVCLVIWVNLIYMLVKIV